MNWVIPGKERLQFHSQADRGFLRRGGLLVLIVVIVSNQRDNETEFLHVLASTGERSCYSRSLTTPCSSGKASLQHFLDTGISLGSSRNAARPMQGATSVKSLAHINGNRGWALPES
jgi:hypothetical protein